MAGIKIDAQEYQVKLTPEPIGGDGGRAILGMETEEANVIIVDGTVPPTRQEEILLHEITHITMPHLPEGAVKEFGARMYGALRDNGLLVEDLLGVVGASKASAEDMARVNKMNKEVQEPPMLMTPGMMRVSEKAWDGPVFDEGGGLLVQEPEGPLNRNAVHQATAQLLGARGGIKMTKGKQRMAARALLGFYREALKEPLPRPLVELSR